MRELGNRITEALPWGPRGTVADGRLRDAGEVVEPTPSRRLVLQPGVLAAASVIVASLAVPLRILRPADAGDRTADDGSTGAPAGSSDPASGTVADGVDRAVRGHGLTVASIASIASVDAKGAARIRIPPDAPSPLPAGDPAPCLAGPRTPRCSSSRSWSTTRPGRSACGPDDVPPWGDPAQ